MNTKKNEGTLKKLRISYLQSQAIPHQTKRPHNAHPLKNATQEAKGGTSGKDCNEAPDGQREGAGKNPPHRTVLPRPKCTIRTLQKSKGASNRSEEAARLMQIVIFKLCRPDMFQKLPH